MKKNVTIALAIAGISGLAAAKLGGDALSRLHAPNVPTKTVLIAKHDLTTSQRLAEEDFEVRQAPAEFVPEHALQEYKEVVGRALASPVTGGQMMYEALLAPPGLDGGLENTIPKGMRAISVEVNESSGLSGLLSPGCKVDVIASVGQNGETIARTIVSDVKVSAVGARTTRESVKESASDKPPSANGVRTVTLIVTPSQAEAIELASLTGRPRLVLRGAEDETTASTKGISMDELLGREKKDPPHPVVIAQASITASPAPIAAPAPAPEPYVAEFIRGGVESVVYFGGPTKHLTTAQDKTKNISLQ